MTEQREVKSLMEEYKWYDVGETRYAVIEKKNIGEFMGRCERENWEVKDIRMSDEFVENMNEYFGVRMDMEFIRIGKEHSRDDEKQRTGLLSALIVFSLFFFFITILETFLEEMSRSARKGWDGGDGDGGGCGGSGGDGCEELNNNSYHESNNNNQQQHKQ
ncbi:Hypothetical predicted protein [Octopus vulgaris]|uniref:Uncharacterized protein n=1 Tax=Octopus vulgaris TaxID=6645 RepID=A0AA36F0P5_OCTVU|nr:Hypothetical predicted protein [Octopus vulgaris]